MNPRRLRAPAEAGAVLADPPLAEAGRLLAANRAILDNATVTIDGLALPEFRRRASGEAVDLARAYLAESGQCPTASAAPVAGLLLSGHQPEWFHPGVWVKNFALHGLARARGLMPLNLVVDTDVPKTTSVRFPCLGPGGPGGVHLRSLPFDHYGNAVPWEERPVRDRGLFEAFAARAAGLSADWPFQPMLHEVWDEVLRRAERTGLPGEAFAGARRAWEQRWGCCNLELPMSRLCESRAFGRFLRHVLSDVPRFHETYNVCVRDYRLRHRVRSRRHPVPDLARDGDRYELPFWTWGPGQTQRGKLLLRRGEGPPPGFKVRTRALMTTLFARLLLGDGFIHGIGGGTYDEVTDDIIERWLGLQPPRFFVLTATVRLPLPGYPARSGDLRSAARTARDLYWNPQRHLLASASDDRHIKDLLARKAELVAAGPAPARPRRDWFRRLRIITEALRPAVAGQIAAAEAHFGEAELEWRANQRLHRRDFAWCLFPEEPLRQYCQSFLQAP